MGIVAPVLAAAGGAATVSTAVTAGGALLKGAAGYKAGKQAAQDAADQAEYAKIRADEVEGARRDELNRTLSSFAAARGANGLNLTSPTALAIAADLRDIADQDRNAEVGNIRREASALSKTSAARAAGARSSLLSGFTSAAPSLFSLFQN